MPDRSLTCSRAGVPTCPPNPPVEALGEIDASHLDRQAVEKRFGVGERLARQLMAGLDGIRAGNATAVPRRA